MLRSEFFDGVYRERVVAGEIVSEILDSSGVTYYLAEEYHQKYLEKNPNGYDCHSTTGIAFPKLAAK